VSVREALHTLAFDAVRATVYGLVILFLFIGANALMGDRQQRTLDDINQGTRATVCVLALPVDSVSGRDQADVRNCLIVSGLTP
jgi:hypothetical protein